MTLPAFIFGSLIAMTLGSFTHLVVGGNLKNLIFMIFFAVIGFWVGNSIVSRFEFHIFDLGPINLPFSVITSIVFALLGRWFSMENPDA